MRLRHTFRCSRRHAPRLARAGGVISSFKHSRLARVADSIPFHLSDAPPRCSRRCAPRLALAEGMISSFNLAMLSPRLAPAGGSSLSFMRCSRRDSRPPHALLFEYAMLSPQALLFRFMLLFAAPLALVAGSSLSIYALLVAHRALFAFRCSVGCIPAALPRLAPAAGSSSSFNSLPQRPRTRLASLSRIAGLGFTLSWIRSSFSIPRRDRPHACIPG